MADRKVKISLRQDASKYLGVNGANDGNWWLNVVAINDHWGTDWIVSDIPFSSAKVLWKSGGGANGWAPDWVNLGWDGNMLVREYKQGNVEQCVVLDDVDGGYIAINNHDRSRVMDRSQRDGDSNAVIVFKWNGHDNQQWMFHDQ